MTNWDQNDRLFAEATKRVAGIVQRVLWALIKVHSKLHCSTTRPVSTHTGNWRIRQLKKGSKKGHGCGFGAYYVRDKTKGRCDHNSSKGHHSMRLFVAPNTCQRNKSASYPALQKLVSVIVLTQCCLVISSWYTNTKDLCVRCRPPSQSSFIPQAEFLSSKRPSKSKRSILSVASLASATRLTWNTRSLCALTIHVSNARLSWSSGNFQRAENSHERNNVGRPFSVLFIHTAHSRVFCKTGIIKRTFSIPAARLRL